MNLRMAEAKGETGSGEGGDTTEKLTQAALSLRLRGKLLGSLIGSACSIVPTHWARLGNEAGQPRPEGKDS